MLAAARLHNKVSLQCLNKFCTISRLRPEQIHDSVLWLAGWFLSSLPPLTWPVLGAAHWFDKAYGLVCHFSLLLPQGAFKKRSSFAHDLPVASQYPWEKLQILPVAVASLFCPLRHSPLPLPYLSLLLFLLLSVETILPAYSSPSQGLCTCCSLCQNAFRFPTQLSACHSGLGSERPSLTMLLNSPFHPPSLPTLPFLLRSSLPEMYINLFMYLLSVSSTRAEAFPIKALESNCFWLRTPEGLCPNHSALLL